MVFIANLDFGFSGSTWMLQCRPRQMTLALPSLRAVERVSGHEKTLLGNSRFAASPDANVASGLVCQGTE